MVEIARRQIGEAGGELEGLGMPDLEWGRIVHLQRLLADCGDDLAAAVARVHAPEPCHTIKDAPPVRREIMHAPGAPQHARRSLE